MEKNITVSFSIRSLILIGFSILVLILAFVVRDIIILFAIAYILASAIRPFVGLLKRYKIPKVASILIMYLGIGLILYFVVRVLVPPMASQANDLLNNRQEISAELQAYLHRLPEDYEVVVLGYLEELPHKVQVLLFKGTTLEGALGLFAGFGGFLTVLFAAFYMLLEDSSFERFIVNIWPGQTREKERMQKAFRQVDQKVSMWVRGQVILSLSIGILTFIGLSILGVPYALVLSIIAAFTEMIPYAGPIIGAIPAVLIAFIVSPVLAFWVVLLTLGIQQFEQHVLVPQVMKRAVGLSAVMVVFSILVGAKLFGILGAIVAVPVAAGIKVMSDSLRKRG